MWSGGRWSTRTAWFAFPALWDHGLVGATRGGEPSLPPIPPPQTGGRSTFTHHVSSRLVKCLDHSSLPLQIPNSWGWSLPIFFVVVAVSEFKFRPFLQIHQRKIAPPPVCNPCHLGENVSSPTYFVYPRNRSLIRRTTAVFHGSGQWNPFKR